MALNVSASEQLVTDRFMDGNATSIDFITALAVFLCFVDYLSVAAPYCTCYPFADCSKKHEWLSGSCRTFPYRFSSTLR